MLGVRNDIERLLGCRALFFVLGKCNLYRTGVDIIPKADTLGTQRMGAKLSVAAPISHYCLYPSCPKLRWVRTIGIALLGQNM